MTRIGHGLRVYDSEESATIVDGVPVRRVRTLAKTLVDGWWEVVTIEGHPPG